MRDRYERALVVGVGEGLSAALARLLAREGMKVGLASRSVEKLGPLAAETGAVTQRCDATARPRWRRCSRRWTPPSAGRRRW